MFLFFAGPSGGGGCAARRSKNRRLRHFLISRRALLCPDDSMDAATNPPHSTINELPIRVREAANFLGVSPQTVYLWVERKQIPHLRVMGRNIRFLKSELESFRAQFKQEIRNGKTE
jgi:excisionase family DNA binding protein